MRSRIFKFIWKCYLSSIHSHNRMNRSQNQNAYKIWWPIDLFWISIIHHVSPISSLNIFFFVEMLSKEESFNTWKPQCTSAHCGFHLLNDYPESGYMHYVGGKECSLCSLYLHRFTKSSIVKMCSLIPFWAVSYFSAIINKNSCKRLAIFPCR